MEYLQGRMVHWLLSGIGAIVLFAGTATVDALASGRVGDPTAKNAGRVDLVEVARLKLSREEGSTVFERGEATGTWDASVTASFDIHPKSVQVAVTIYPRGGSITGTADASYEVVKNLGYFGGNFTVSRGTGKYGHVSEVDGKPFGFSGIINRDTFDVEVKVTKGEINF